MEVGRAVSDDTDVSTGSMKANELEEREKLRFRSFGLILSDSESTMIWGCKYWVRNTGCISKGQSVGFVM